MRRIHNADEVEIEIDWVGNVPEIHIYIDNDRLTNVGDILLEAGENMVAVSPNIANDIASRLDMAKESICDDPTRKEWQQRVDSNDEYDFLR